MVACLSRRLVTFSEGCVLWQQFFCNPVLIWYIHGYLNTLSLVIFDPRSLPFKVTLHLCCTVMFRLGGARSILEGDCTVCDVFFYCMCLIFIWGNQNKSTSLETVFPLPIDACFLVGFSTSGILLEEETLEKILWLLSFSSPVFLLFPPIIFALWCYPSSICYSVNQTYLAMSVTACSRNTRICMVLTVS